MLSLQFPVFILADAMKFMDVVHAVKPNPVTDVPQATVAHDSFWDYVANNQESAHMVMWLMSMRGRPRSWRMMGGWVINTFRFINHQGKSTFVRFVWKPLLGVHSLLMDEANIIGGVDPDFHRHDIIEAVQKGVYPEYELGVQLIPEEDEFKYEFDVLDATILWPEEVIPVEIISKFTLNRLVDNFFAEEEQSSFDPATLVPGIDVTNDPVLQGRLFAYRDTDYHRLGTANINEIPVNRPISEVNTNHRDGFSKYRIDVDPINYHENSLANNTPEETSLEKGGYVYYPEKVEGYMTREYPSESHAPITKSSPALSMANTTYSAKTQKVGVLIGNGFNDEEVQSVFSLMDQNQVFYEIISEKLGTVTGIGGTKIEVNETFVTTYPVLFDSLYVVGGNADKQVKFDQDVTEFINTAYKYFKPIGIATTAQSYIQASENLPGVIFATKNPNFGDEFIAAVAKQRFWDRTQYKI